MTTRSSAWEAAATAGAAEEQEAAAPAAAAGIDKGRADGASANSTHGGKEALLLRQHTMPTAAAAAAPPSPMRQKQQQPQQQQLYLVRNVQSKMFLDAGVPTVQQKTQITAGAARWSDSRHASVAMRNGRPSQLVAFRHDGRIVAETTTATTKATTASSSAGTGAAAGKEKQVPQLLLLAADWSDELRSYTAGVAWKVESDLNDPDADAMWALTADGMIRHRASGRVLGLGMNFLVWPHGTLYLHPPEPSNPSQYWQLIPSDRF
jgi:hypothetical protein